MKTYTISDDHCVYSMSGANKPALSVPSGSRVLFETWDCFHGQITSPDQSIDSLNWERINPATGPLFVEGAEPGDALEVVVEDISLVGNGVMAAIPGVGVFGRAIEQSAVRILPIADGQVQFGDGIQLPVTPMIGVIGTAPKGKGVPCGTPGHHGGNMDCREIRAGVTLYLPVFRPGGLLSMGDVHACMGDGEIMGTGVEIGAHIQVRVNLVKDTPLTDPILETEEMLYAIVSDRTMEKASVRAAELLARAAMDTLGLDYPSAGMLLSAVGSLEVCQIVDPKVTVRFGLPRRHLYR